MSETAEITWNILADDNQKEYRNEAFECNTTLALKHFHPRDIRIKFIEKTHKYVIDGSSEGYISTTALCGSHFSEFDENKSIKSMKISRQRPDHYAYQLSDDEIKEVWKQNRDDGTAMHDNIEKYMNLDMYDWQSKEFKMFQNFQRDYPYYRPYRTEWRVFCEKLKLAGSIDMVFMDMRTGKLVIADWKRTKFISMIGFCKCSKKRKLGKIDIIHDINTCEGFGKSEITKHLPDSNFYHYTIQLNIYRAILKLNYNIVIDKLFLVVLHPNQPDYAKMDIDILEDVTKAMLHKRLLELKKNLGQ